MIKIEADICTEFEAASSREWLETNGIGGYSSGTISGANSRRYHGLLVAATRPPLGRMVLLSKFEETVIVGGDRFELSSNRYPGTVHPDGYKYLTGFRLDPFPVWTYAVGGMVVERSIFMVSGENSAVIQWKLQENSGAGGGEIKLEIRPMLAFRDHHHLRHEDARFNGAYEATEATVSMRPYAEMPQLIFGHNAVEVEKQGYWYRDIEYAIEQERGFDYREDLFQPFCLKFDLTSKAVVIASTEERKWDEAGALEKREMKRRAALIAKAGAKDAFTRQLVLAADQFIVKRGGGNTIIAGYHWFSDWGRDTMIALSGLTLTTGRPEIAKSILTEFSEHISEGMLPNRFPDAGETPEYNTVDATLWYFEAIRAYIAATGDYDFVRNELYEKLVDIIDWHVSGTRYQIHVDTDGLLYSGEPGVQLTWMDAKIGGYVVTPRTGKAVEIQALWYNALRIMADLARRFDEFTLQTKYEEMADIARESFNGQFWNEAAGCLYDVVNGESKDASIRPNQIFAVSLPHSMLGAERALAVVDKVEAELLTSVGLRSLSPNDPDYKPIYIGSPYDRDTAYHQGTVWGWLIGPFVNAYRHVHSDREDLESCVAVILAGFMDHINEAMVGQVSEIFDAETPHFPRGCAAQAWSVAELLRVLSK